MRAGCKGLPLVVMVGSLLLAACSSGEHAPTEALGRQRSGLGVVDCPAGYNVVEGTPGPDVLRGGPGNDCIVGHGGDDQIDGRAGSDVIFGGPGNDLIRGGGGDDRLYGEEGDDTVNGEAGNDFIRGGLGDDELTGGTASDDVDGGEGNDTINGGVGDDVLAGGSGDDTILGHAGADAIDGGDGNDVLDGGGAGDTIQGGSGNDIIIGTPQDSADGGSGIDSCPSGCELPEAGGCATDPDCAAGQVCVAGACVACVSDAACSDGSVCNGAETCVPASGCQPGVTPDCGDTNECTSDSCDAALGCRNTPAAAGTSCAGGSGACDGVGACQPLAYPPVAVADSYATDEDQPSVLDPLENDYDLNGDSLRITSVLATRGLVEILADDTVRYTPPRDFTGTDSFGYVVADDGGLTATTVVLVQVNPVPDAPRCLAGPMTVPEDSSGQFYSLDALVSDPDGDAVDLTSVRARFSGTASITGALALRYWPNPNYFGTDHIEYTVADRTGRTCESVLVVNVLPVDDCFSNNGGCDAQTQCLDSPSGVACGPCPANHTGSGATGCTPAAGPSLAAGNYHTCAIVAAGKVKCWGWNNVGQLGLGDTANRGTAPTQMGPGLPTVDLGSGRTATALAAGAAHTCALLDDGSVKCWGANAFGQLGLGDIQARGDQPGEMGDALPQVALGTGQAAMALAAGEDHTCAQLATGALKCWGGNNGGQLGLGDTNHRGDGPGEMGDSLTPISLGSGAVYGLTAGEGFTCALFASGQVKCWGYNFFGQLGVGNTLARGDQPGEMGNALPFVSLPFGRPAIGLSSGLSHTCALLHDGSVRCWGYNSAGQLGLGDTQTRGDSFGEVSTSPSVALGSGRTATLVATGYIRSCAVLDDGSTKCWGAAGGGALGLGDQQTRGDEPGEMGDALPAVDLGTGLTPTELVSGYFHACAELGDGSIKCWGYNGFGSLGLGDSEDRGDEPGEMGDALPAVDLSSPDYLGECGVASDCAAPPGTSATCLVDSAGAGLCGYDADIAVAGLRAFPDVPDYSLFLSFWAGSDLNAHLSRVDVATGVATPLAYSAPSGPAHGLKRQSIWIDNGGTNRLSLGHHENVLGHDSNAGVIGSWVRFGCCDLAIDRVLAIDSSGGRAYFSGASELFELDLSSFAVLRQWATPGIHSGYHHLGDNVVWVAGDGVVARVDLGTSASQVFSVEAPRGFYLPPGAVTVDGGFVVPSTTGQLVHLGSDGAPVFPAQSYTSPNPGWSGWFINDGGTPVPMPVVVLDSGLIVVNTGDPGVAAYDQQTGALVWLTPTSAVPTALLIGDGGIVYAYESAIGRVIGLDLATGGVRYRFEGAPISGPGIPVDLALRDGVLYVSGGKTLLALRVPSQGYPPEAEWPTVFHDNQRTSNALGSFAY